MRILRARRAGDARLGNGGRLMGTPMTDTTEYVSVPKVLTDKMVSASYAVPQDRTWASQMRAAWAAMLAAAPPPPSPWKDIESAPKDGTEIILAIPGGVTPGYWHENDPQYEFDHPVGGSGLINPTLVFAIPPTGCPYLPLQQMGGRNEYS